MSKAFYLEYYDRKFIEGCLTRGKNEKEIMFKFFSFYIALNFLYTDRDLYDNTKKKEKDILIEFIEKVMNQNYESFLDFKYFYDFLPENSELLEKPVCRDTKFIAQGDLKTLFSNIYRIRCNLFHGSKRMHSIRDTRLVTDCCTVLERFLEQFLKAMKER